MTCAEALIVGGAALEIVGVLLVVMEIARDVREARRIAPTQQERVLGTVIDRADPTFGGETLEERVDHLEQAVLKDWRYGAGIEQGLESVRAELANRVLDQRYVLTKFLGQMLRAGVSLRLIGVGLIVLGIIASSIGSIVAN